MKPTTAEIAAFDKTFAVSLEDDASNSRGEFVRLFPASQLGTLTLDRYAIGRGKHTFCYYVEPGTVKWAQIKGATALKFGIYFGHTKSEPADTYRFQPRFGSTPASAFRSVRGYLAELVSEAGRPSPDFAAIDDNPLSQMFKAKIISLYYPKSFINICSSEHLRLIGSELGLPELKYVSEYQHQITKLRDSMVPSWSNPKFMHFLYAKYIRDDLATPGLTAPKTPPEVDFEKLVAGWKLQGEKAEQFAIAWETDRLLGLSLSPNLLRDVRSRPGYGYDLQSVESDGETPRQIEVKSVGRRSGVERFFLSGHERTTSLLPANASSYYFYLVYFDRSGNPAELRPIAASEVYEVSSVDPVCYQVSFVSNRD